METVLLFGCFIHASGYIVHALGLMGIMGLYLYVLLRKYKCVGFSELIICVINS